MSRRQKLIHMDDETTRKENKTENRKLSLMILYDYFKCMFTVNVLVVLDERKKSIQT